jgi:hypothetical protein
MQTFPFFFGTRRIGAEYGLLDGRTIPLAYILSETPVIFVDCGEFDMTASE